MSRASDTASSFSSTIDFGPEIEIALEGYASTAHPLLDDSESGSTTRSRHSASKKQCCKDQKAAWPHCCQEHWEKFYAQEAHLSTNRGTGQVHNEFVRSNNEQLPHVAPEGIFDRCVDCRELCPLKSTTTAGYNKNCDFDYGPYYAEQAARGTCQIQYWDGHYYIPYKNCSVWWNASPMYGCFQAVNPNQICYNDCTGDIVPPTNPNPKAQQCCPTTNVNKCCVPQVATFLPWKRCCEKKRPKPVFQCCAYDNQFDLPDSAGRTVPYNVHGATQQLSQRREPKVLLDDAPYDYYYGLDSFTDFVPNAVHRYPRVQENGLVTD